MALDRIGAQDAARLYAAGVQQSDKTDVAAGQAGKKAAPAPAADQVVLSEQARALAAARQAVAAAPDVREEKVADIEQRLADGTYSVSPSVLARKILDQVLGES